jgi:hypothetical protein
MLRASARCTATAEGAVGCRHGWQGQSLQISLAYASSAWHAITSRRHALSHRDASTVGVKVTGPGIVLWRRLLGRASEAPHCCIRSAVVVGCCGRRHHSSPVHTSWTTRRLPARPPSTLPAVPSPAGAGGGVFGQSLEPELGPSFSSPTSALVETSSQLADIPWDPMSYEWGAMSKPGSPAVVLQGGDERRGVACWEPELVVDRRSEAPQ